MSRALRTIRDVVVECERLGFTVDFSFLPKDRLPRSLWFDRVQRLLVAMQPLKRAELVKLVRAIDPGYGYGFRIPTSGRRRDDLLRIVAGHVVDRVAYDFSGLVWKRESETSKAAAPDGETA